MRNSPALIVGFSGGLDSTVLLDAAVAVLGATRVVAVHVNHGLQAQAASWAEHAQAQAAALGCRFQLVRLTPTPALQSGVEDWARQARRRALHQQAAQLGAQAILLAHHADDQVETLLMHWGRGAGPAGMRGMAAVSTLDGLALLRPLLAVPRQSLHDYAQARGLHWVTDPSNADTRWRRNRLRHEVLPLLETVFPGFRANVLRGAELQAAQLATLEAQQLAAIDAGPDDSFDRRPLQGRSDDELDALVHAWLRHLGKAAPTRARTQHIRAQLFRSPATYAEIAHDGGWIRRYRDRVSFVGSAPEASHDAPPEAPLHWQGEPVLALPGFAGQLRFDAAGPGEAGLLAELLRDPALIVSGLRMNASIRLQADRPSRRIRKLCQEQGVPQWARAGLPMLSLDGQTVFVAGQGMNADLTASSGPNRYRLAFEPTTPIITGS